MDARPHLYLQICRLNTAPCAACTNTREGWTGILCKNIPAVCKIRTTCMLRPSAFSIFQRAALGTELLPSNGRVALGETRGGRRGVLPASTNSSTFSSSGYSSPSSSGRLLSRAPRDGSGGGLASPARARPPFLLKRQEEAHSNGKKPRSHNFSPQPTGAWRAFCAGRMLTAVNKVCLPCTSAST